MAETTGSPIGAAALQVDALCCGYNGLQLVHDLDLSIAPGEIVALLGANGAGKSTTLLTLAGVISPISGSISMHGAPLGGPLQRRARAGLGLLKESTSVFPTLTAERNLALGFGSVERAYEIAPELRDLHRRRGGLLSGGEQRILAMARALAGEPSVLLVDELSLGLAPKVTDRLLTLLREHADRGTAVLLVEQHPRKALVVADRAIVIRRGRKVLESSSAELLTRIDDLHQIYLGA